MAGERSPGEINRRAQAGEENNGLDDETDDACAVSHWFVVVQAPAGR
jgi:hypothetical protein